MMPPPISEQRNADVADVTIKSERIMKILDEAILKMDIAFSMPILLQNLDQYKNNFGDDELQVLSKCKVYQRQEENKQSVSDENVNNEDDEDIHNGEDFEMSYLEPLSYETEDPIIKRAIEILWKRPDISNLVKSKTPEPSSDNPLVIFIRQMRALRDLFQTSLTEDLSCETEKNKIQHYREIWKKNEEAKSAIKNLQPTLTNITSRIENELKSKDDEIQELLDKIENLKINCKEEVKAICTDFEMKMVAESKNGESRTEVIENDIKILEEKFGETLKDNLNKEKELRTKRYKIETQLESILDKYDTDMGARQAEFEQIQAEFDEEELQMNILQENFDKQEIEYVALMKEKAIEERMELDRKIEDLRWRVAARIIQTKWRELKRRRLERAKMRKGKKGKAKKKTGKKSPSPKRPESAASSKKNGLPKK